MTGNPMAEKKDISDWCTELKNLRDAIDGIDEKILELLNRRLDLAHQIGQIKNENRQKTIDKNRENDILKRLSSANSGLLADKPLERIFREIIAAAREVQQTRMIP